MFHNQKFNKSFALNEKENVSENANFVALPANN